MFSHVTVFLTSHLFCLMDRDSHSLCVSGSTREHFIIKLQQKIMVVRKDILLIGMAIFKFDGSELALKKSGFKYAIKKTIFMIFINIEYKVINLAWDVKQVRNVFWYLRNQLMFESVQLRP